MGDGFWCGQTQTRLTWEFQVKFDRGQGRLLPNYTAIIELLQD